MCELEETHPDVHSLFAAGYHVVRRSNKYRAGLSTDLSIEQILMRSLKTIGGLTRGRGMSEYQRSLWLLSSPICAEITQSLQILTEVNYSTSEQHKETSKSRQERDHKDLLVLLLHHMDDLTFKFKKFTHFGKCVSGYSCYPLK